MKRNNLTSSVFVIFVLLLGVFPAIPAFGAEGKDSFSATLTDLGGEVSIQKPDEEIWLPVEKDMPLEESDRIKTGAGSFVEILIDDGSLLRVEENSEIVLTGLSADFETKWMQAAIFLRIGRLLSNITQFVDSRSRFHVRTPTTVTGVRGTEFIVETTDAQETEVGVFDGQVFVGGIGEQGNLIEGSEVPVTKGNQTIVRKSKRPRRPFALRGRMLLHKKRMVLHRKRALDRRRNIHRIRGRRLRIHKRTLERWKGIRMIHRRQRPRPGSPPPPGPRP
ncbi:MAG: hypothetical protein GY849_14945, partial [Deltaproteobacteria bacterium]|nr:hypothetical protein [Deltaproteobacteria bacterium]